ncbi:MAG: flagellar protein FlgN [Candidatus Latescibacteria bacterium]|nr:flagellar protein FlgN [Candidatus Latescibacterota bacterium]
MSDPLVVKLIEIVNSEIRVFNRLLEILQLEQKALCADDLEAIEGCLAAKKEAAEEARRMETERLLVVQKISKRLEMEPENCTLSRLVEVVEGWQGEELARMRETMMELNRRIRATNESNAFLIRQSMRYTERCLDILSGQPGNRGVYGQFGRARRGSGMRTLVNRTA